MDPPTPRGGHVTPDFSDNEENARIRRAHSSIEKCFEEEDYRAIISLFLKHKGFDVFDGSKVNRVLFVNSLKSLSFTPRKITKIFIVVMGVVAKEISSKTKKKAVKLNLRKLVKLYKSKKPIHLNVAQTVGIIERLLAKA